GLGDVRSGSDGNDLIVGIYNAGGLQPFQRALSVLQRFSGSERFGCEHDQGVVRGQSGQPALYGVAIDVGHKMNISPRAGVTEGADGQPYAPVAAAYADVHDIAPPSLGVGQSHEFVQTLSFSGYFIDRRGSAQGGMPGCAVFGNVGYA